MKAAALVQDLASQTNFRTIIFQCLVKICELVRLQGIESDVLQHFRVCMLMKDEVNRSTEIIEREV